MNPILKLTTPPGMGWCQDSNRVLVIVEPAGLAVSLTGLDAAIWKWFALAYPFETVMRFTETFLALPELETLERLNQILNHWVELGLLVGEEST